MARQFNPGEHQSGDDGGYLDVAGEYILAGRTLKRDKSRKGKEFFLVRFEVLHGPLKGRGFRQRIYINDEALWKVGKWCEAMEQKDNFDLDCNRSSYLALCNLPFKARVSVRTEGGDNGTTKKYPEVDSFYTRVTEQEVAFFNKWRAGWEAEVEASGDKQEPAAGKRMSDNGSSGSHDSAGFGDDPGPAGYGSGGGRSSAADDFGEDDIPF